MLLLATSVAAVYGTAKAEERDSLATFGVAYAEYRKTSKTFILFVL